MHYLVVKQYFYYLGNKDKSSCTMGWFNATEVRLDFSAADRWQRRHHEAPLQFAQSVIWIPEVTREQ